MQAISFRNISTIEVKDKTITFKLTNGSICTSEYLTNKRAIEVFEEITNNINFPCIVFK